MRWRLAISYDGTDFHGWARQPGLRTVQGTLEEWVTRVLRLSDPVEIVCAGRTDAGVHARGQVAHLDLPDEVDAAALPRRLARVLPGDVMVGAVEQVPEAFDARFTALWRRYCYRVCPGPVDPLRRGHVVSLRAPLDPQLLTAAGQRLVGLHDFTAFCKPREGASTIRTLQEVSVAAEDDGVLGIWVQADAFCHSMVRSVVGALVTVASGRREPAWLEELLQATGRPSTVQVMPAHGLVLEEVRYPPDDQLAERDRQARRLRTRSELS